MTMTIANAMTPAQETLNRVARVAIGRLDAVNWQNGPTDECAPHLFDFDVAWNAMRAVGRLSLAERNDLVEAREDNQYFYRIRVELEKRVQVSDFAVVSLILAMFRLTEEFGLGPVVFGD